MVVAWVAMVVGRVVAVAAVKGAAKAEKAVGRVGTAAVRVGRVGLAVGPTAAGWQGSQCRCGYRRCRLRF